MVLGNGVNEDDDDHVEEEDGTQGVLQSTSSLPLPQGG